MREIELNNVKIIFDNKEKDGKLVLANMKLQDISETGADQGIHDEGFLISDNQDLGTGCMETAFLGLIKYIFKGRIIDKSSLISFVEDVFARLGQERAEAAFLIIKEDPDVRVTSL